MRMKRLVGAFTVLLVLGLVAMVWAAESANKVGGSYIVYPNKKGATIFSHLTHANAGYNCASCHPAIAMKKGTVKMTDILQGKACGKCHNGKTKAPKTADVAFAVKDCSSCHMPEAPLTFKTKGLGPVTFDHVKHTGTAKGEEAGYACGACHPKLFQRKNGAPINMKFPHSNTGCATCHDGKQVSPSGQSAFAASANCTKCHKPAAAQ